MTVNSLKDTVGSNALLGKTVSYPESYDAGLLFAVSRNQQRNAMKFCSDIEFFGVDIWNVYELCWLNSKGLPVRKTLKILISSDSLFLPESKSVKLYLNSLNFTKFSHENHVLALIKRDLENVCKSNIEVSFDPEEINLFSLDELKNYQCIDEQDVAISSYQRDINLLTSLKGTAHEKLVSHLFKSHCLCTGQPDWGSIFIEYEGESICHKGLLAYLVSFNKHVGFSENCIEQIFVDLKSRFNLERLTVFGRFLRRGGIDINPYRSTHQEKFYNFRLHWQ